MTKWFYWEIWGNFSKYPSSCACLWLLYGLRKKVHVSREASCSVVNFRCGTIDLKEIYFAKFQALHGSKVFLRGSGVSGSRFGMTLVDAGDIDRNGYNDVIVGAPSEKLTETDTTSGVVYIYFASQTGLDTASVQVR